MDCPCIGDERHGQWSSSGPSPTPPLNSSFFLTLAFTASAQHVHYRIPEVEQNAQYMRSRFADWHTYHSPTGTATRATRTGRLHRPPPTPTWTCAYWLEDTNHQGFSPFHPIRPIIGFSVMSRTLAPKVTNSLFFAKRRA